MQKVEQEYILKISTALTRANHLAFWKNLCLVQSYAGRLMLNKRRIKSILSIGVAKGESKNLKAHAWLTAQNIELVHGSLDYKPLFKMD